MKNILVLSPFSPYKTIKHAGGQIHYYYINKLIKENNIIHISTATVDEISEIKQYSVQCEKIIKFLNSNTFFNKIYENFFAKFIQKNPFDNYSGFVDYRKHFFFLKKCKELSKKKYIPDIVLLDFTQTVFLTHKIKKLFPDSKIICIEQDVTFLKYYRFYKDSKNFVKKAVNYFKYLNIQKKELYNLSQANEILVLNNKDKNLLINSNVNPQKIRTIVPYFNIYDKINRSKHNNFDLLFFGAMSRPENYLSAIWFIENIFNKLPEKFNFIIIGNNPHFSLLKYSSNRIIIKGFVEDITPYLEKSLCFVAPIQSGGGIKIKILEVMSSGLPVLTNSIGIEGIPAENNKEFLFCENPQDYIDYILSLSDNFAFCSEIGNNGKEFILNNFSYGNESYVK